MPRLRRSSHESANPHLLFHATTISPIAIDRQPLLVERRRILDVIQRQPNDAAFTYITGPIGSGKTTLALQWAQHSAKSVQYVCARENMEVPEHWISDADEFGLALQNLLNACAPGSAPPSQEIIQKHLQHTITLLKQTDTVFILDDLELLGREAATILQSLLVDRLPRTETNRGLIVSRTIDTNILGALQASNALRVVLPSTLEFNSQEIEEGHRIGVFGSATLQEVRVAHKEAGGWISGMLVDLERHGGNTILANDFRNHLLNDMLIQQPKPILHAMLTAAILPFNTQEIWERWFDHLGVPGWIIPSTLTQLPVIQQRSRFRIAPVMRSSLIQLESLLSDTSLIDQLVEIALHWYVENNEIAAASTLSTHRETGPRLLELLRPRINVHAEREDWSSIVAIVKEVQEDIILQDPEISFWYFHGLVESDQWSEMNRMASRIFPAIAASNDPTLQARSHLINAWRSYMLNDADTALNESVSAYTLLPESAHRDRLWAAGTASIAESQRGNQSAGRRWSALANYELTLVPHNPRWWHNNAGPIHLSWLAVSGMLDETYGFAARQIQALRGVDESNMVRYLLIQAVIDTERLNFEGAQQSVAEAAALVGPRYSQDHHFRIVQANLARAMGQPRKGLSQLSATAAPVHQRADQFRRETFTRARLALDAGDISAADLHLGAAPFADDFWPGHFGDPHPRLLQAFIEHHRGDTGAAVTSVETTLNQARRRKHTYFAVRSLAMLAYIHHRNGDTRKSDRTIDEAIAESGNSGFQLAFVVNDQDVRSFHSTDPLGLEDSSPDAPQGFGSEFSLSPDRLTNRETEVLRLAAQSLSNKEIAERMFISVSTVKNHLASTYDKLGTNNRRTAVQIARKIGLVDS